MQVLLKVFKYKYIYIHLQSIHDLTITDYARCVHDCVMYTLGCT